MDRVLPKKKWYQRPVTFYIMLGVAFVAVIGWALKDAAENKLNVERDRLTVGTVTKGMFQESFPVTGEVLPIKTIYIDAKEGGVVEEIYLEGGENVKKGDPVLRLSNTSIEMSYMSQKTSLMGQINDLENQKIQVKQEGLRLEEQLLDIEFQIKDLSRRFRADSILLQSGAIPEEEYLKTKNDYEYQLSRREILRKRLANEARSSALQAEIIDPSLANLRQNIKFIDEGLDNLTVRALIGGQISTISAELGQTINQGANICQIDVLDSYKVRARVDQHYNSDVRRGLEASFKYNGQDYQLELSKIYPEVVNGEFEVDMDFPETAPDGIKRGQTLQIRVYTSGKEEAVMVPLGGFYNSTGGQWVYVLDEATGEAVKREVKLGRKNRDYYEVVSGLSAGEKVITSSYDSFDKFEKLVVK